MVCADFDCDRTDVVGRGLCSKHYQRYRYRGQLDEMAPEPESKACARCGSAFSPILRRWGALYCSRRCNDSARRAREQEARARRSENCEQCGASLTGKYVSARFCSNACGQNWRNARIAEATRAAKMAMKRTCRSCGEPIPVDRFVNALYCSDPCKIRARRHEAYGLTKRELELLLAQHEICAICKSDDWGVKGPQVDHCHATGKVRGILCANCNNGLGRFVDDPVRLRSAAEYLERS